jgi:hypothetical protein
MVYLCSITLKQRDMKTENNNEATQLGIGAIRSRFLSELSDIKPCPFCGNKMPFSYYNPSTAYLGCDDCGINFGSAQVLYKIDELPEELKGLEYEADALVIIEKDGTRTKYPEHNRVGINCVIAFDHKGILSKWNKRS